MATITFTKEQVDFIKGEMKGMSRTFINKMFEDNSDDESDDEGWTDSKATTLASSVFTTRAFKIGKVQDVEPSKKGEKIKKVKKEKDPNAPKRPTNAYFYWLNKHGGRDKVKEDFPELKGKEITTKAGEIWSEMETNGGRAKYQKMAAKDKERYEKEMAEYKGIKVSTEHAIGDEHDVGDEHANAKPKSKAKSKTKEPTKSNTNKKEKAKAKPEVEDTPNSSCSDSDSD